MTKDELIKLSEKISAGSASPEELTMFVNELRENIDAMNTLLENNS